jgi:hypothetical protein
MILEMDFQGILMVAAYGERVIVNKQAVAVFINIAKNEYST